MNTKVWIWTGLVAATVAGGLIRMAPINDRPLWYDEADTWSASIDGATRPLPYVRFLQWENHFETAPLSFLFVRMSSDITGNTSEESMRLPSLIFGTLCIPAMFLLGRIVHGNALGLAAAALAAVDPNMVDQSQQARMYMVMIFFTIIAIAWSIKLLRNFQSDGSEDRFNRNVWNWVGLGIVLGLLLCTQQFTAAVWIGIAFGVVAIVIGGRLTGQPHPQPWRVLSGFTCAFIIGLLVAQVGVFKLFERVLGSEGGQGDGAHLSFMEIGREIATAAKDLIGWGNGGLIVYPLAMIGTVLLVRRCKTSVAVLGGVVIANLLILFPFRKMHHFMDARYLSMMQPLLFIGLAMLAIGFQKRPWRIAGCVVLIALLGAQLWRSTHLTPYYMQPDRYLFAKQIINVRDQIEANPKDAALIHPGPAFILAKYYELPQAETLYEGFYDPITTQPLPDGKFPATFDAPAVWVIMGMNNYPGRIEKARTLLKEVADHYGVTLDQVTMDKHIALERVVAARVSKEGIEFQSMGLHD